MVRVIAETDPEARHIYLALLRKDIDVEYEKESERQAKIKRLGDLNRKYKLTDEEQYEKYELMVSFIAFATATETTFSKSNSLIAFSISDSIAELTSAL